MLWLKRIIYFILEYDKNKYWIIILWLAAVLCVTIDRLISFAAIFLFIITYKIFFKCVLHLYLMESGIFEFYIQKNQKRFLKINRILIKIQKWRNPFLVLFEYLDNVLNELIIYLNYVLIKSKHLNFLLKDKIYLELLYILMNLICGGTLKIIFGFIYKTFYNYLKNEKITTVFIRRLSLLIISVIIFTDINKAIRENILNYFLILNIIIIIWYFLVFAYCKYGKYTWVYNICFNILNNHFNVYLTTHGLIKWRNRTTILGYIIEFINYYSTYDEIANLNPVHKTSKINHKEVFNDEWSVPSLFMIQGYENIYEDLNQIKSIIHFEYVKKPYDIKYFNDLSNLSIYLEINFLYLWYSYKYIDSTLDIKKKCYIIKNYPSFFLYNYLIQQLLWILNFDSLTNWIYYFIIIKKYHIVLNNKQINALNFVYDFDKKRVELLLYMILDIEYCLNRNFNYLYFEFIEYFDIVYGKNIINVYKLSINKELRDPWKIEDFILKKENKFYDIDKNKTFFINMFKYYITIDNYIKDVMIQDKKESKLNPPFYYISQELKKYADIRLFLWREFELKNSKIQEIHMDFLEGKQLSGFSFNRLINEQINNIIHLEYEELIKTQMEYIINDTLKNWNTKKGVNLIVQTFNELELIYNQVNVFESD